MPEHLLREDIFAAGALAHKTRTFGASLIVPGASYNSIISRIRQFIIDNGGICAFPPQMALNDVAAHFLCDIGQDITLTDQLVCLDVGVCVNGAIGDCAITVDLSGKSQALVASAQEALEAAVSIIRVGTTLGEIGAVIESTIAKAGFTSIKNLSGHGLGSYQIHTPPTIPNYDNNSTKKITADMLFAIEPFATTGNGLIYEGANPTIFSLLHKKPVRSQSSREALTIIDTFKGLPFCTHDLAAKMPLFKVQLALRELLAAQVIMAHPPLIEQSHGLVAQAEHTVYVDSQGIVHVTTK